MTPRIDKMSAPPEVGKWYMVPCVLSKYPYQNISETISRFWPVIGSRHTDKEFFNFTSEHFHVDPRFISDRHLHLFSPSLANSIDAITVKPIIPIGDVRLLRRKCHQNIVEYNHSRQPYVMQLCHAYAGVQCKKNEAGWVCPHRLTSLGSVAPVDGVITCFLHGLKIDASTGKCLEAK